MNKLVIVESPAKAHTIGRILGPDYKVMASVGHVRDLPEHKLGIDISADDRRFVPNYVVSDDKKRIVDDLAKAARKADEIYLASDPDREGEAIAWHVRDVLSEALDKDAAKKTFRRIEYNEITPAAVRNALAHPHDIDMGRVNAQQARRLLDRLVGWKVSPSLRRSGVPAAQARSLSAGRVQSVALRMVCEREREVRAFRPVPFWDWSVHLHKDGGQPDSFVAQLTKLDGARPDVHDEASADAVTAFLSSAAFTVARVVHGQKRRNPGPPFTTSTLQQRASTVLGFAPDLTMRLAQELYEHSLITYMRTDSRAVSKDAQAMADAYVREHWGAEFANAHTYGNKAGAQAAHEAIRPTDPRTEPGTVAGALAGIRDAERAASLYGLIWRQFITSQMAPAVYETLSVEVAAAPGPGADPAAPRREAVLTASTARVVFPGFLQAEPERLRTEQYRPDREEADEDRGGEEHESDAVSSLPALSEGETLGSLGAEPHRKETKPRPRFNEASLVRELERNGIGRPSTFASVIATLKNRRYVESRARVLTPTELGEKVESYLVPHFPELFDVGFTAHMETLLDEVEDPERKLDWQGMLADFYARLRDWLVQARGPSADPDAVRRVLEKFREVRVWAAPRRSGARTYSDLKFVQDMADEFAGVSSPRRKSGDGYAFDPPSEPARAFTDRQFRFLVGTLLHYRDQIPDLEDFVRSLGREDLLVDEALQPPDAATIRLVETLSACGVEPRDQRFFDSLAEQVRGGKRLSDRQRHYLGEIFLNAASRVPDFSPALCESLGVEYHEPVRIDADRVSALLSGLSHVTKWNPPVRHGRRTFDDREFVASVAAQFGSRGSLTERQLAALDRLFLRYRDQIDGSEAIIAKFQVKAPPRRSRRTASAVENEPPSAT